MATLRQIESNRRNAAHSTGPRSVEGKAASRMNALKSGIHAESTIIIPEDPAALAQLVDSFYRDYQPQAAMEAALLDNVIRDTWMLTRFARIDAEIIGYQIEAERYPLEVNQAGKAFKDSFNDQIRLQRRIDATRKSQNPILQGIPAPPGRTPRPTRPATPAPRPTARRNCRSLNR
jgi:hypothetical protein